MQGSSLFTPLTVGGLTLRNRIIIAPMCQYSAHNGCMGDWHLIHLGHLALSGAGLLTVEATAVLPEGRLTPFDAGLWDDACAAAMGRTLAAIRRHSDMPISVQLGHAGRKASTEVEWRGMRQLQPDAALGWQTVAPSPLPYAPVDHAPLALDEPGLARIRKAFGDSARRAASVGVDAIQLHFAHGYLAHQFLSPLSNKRDDACGGSLENRMRFPLQLFDAAREAFPSERPVTVRVSGTDWIEGGWDIEQCIAFAQALERHGCAGINVSSGGLAPEQTIPVSPNYQVPLARAIKRAVSIPVVAVGLITEFEQAEAIVATGDADAIGLARAILFDPRWPWHAAAALGGVVRAPIQYARSVPRRYAGLFEHAEPLA